VTFLGNAQINTGQHDAVLQRTRVDLEKYTLGLSFARMPSLAVAGAKRRGDHDNPAAQCWPIVISAGPGCLPFPARLAAPLPRKKAYQNWSCFVTRDGGALTGAVTGLLTPPR
jgi:hypothetical protein